MTGTLGGEISPDFYNQSSVSYDISYSREEEVKKKEGEGRREEKKREGKKEEEDRKKKLIQFVPQTAAQGRRIRKEKKRK